MGLLSRPDIVTTDEASMHVAVVAKVSEILSKPKVYLGAGNKNGDRKASPSASEEYSVLLTLLFFTNLYVFHSSVDLYKMADAVCGPSNALQNFQKHTSVDRTLQQDRTISGRQPAQGFRSIASTSGALDAEFHAFQAPQIQSTPLQRAQLPLAHVTRYATPPLQVMPDWASDFQKMNLIGSRPPPVAAQQGSQIPRAAQGGWGTGFVEQKDLQTQAPIQQLEYNQWQPQYQGVGSYGGDMMYTQNRQQSVPEHLTSAEAHFDDAAFAQAFAQVSEDMQKDAKDKGKEKSLEEFDMAHACTDPGDVLGADPKGDVLEKFDFEEFLDDAHYKGRGYEQMSRVERKENLEITDPNDVLYGFDFDKYKTVEEEIPPRETRPTQTIPEEPPDRGPESLEQDHPRIGADTISAKTESEAINPQIEADELSRTAGHLLDTLKDEKNTKFQQSSFLALMRQLRDKEVKVDGDKMVPVSPLNT